MSNLVYTVKGLIELDELEVKDHIEVFHNCRKITTHFLHNGEVVRTDVAASMLRGPGESQATPGKMNG